MNGYKAGLRDPRSIAFGDSFASDEPYNPTKIEALKPRRLRNKGLRLMVPFTRCDDCEN